MKRFLSARGWDWKFALGFVVLASVVGYLLASRWIYSVGFPLDDAWIHQTYARNLGERGEWSFQPGEPSAGSTSPLWSILLAIGYAVKSSPYFWTFLLGGLCLWGVAITGELLFRRDLANGLPGFAPIPMGLLLGLEWHLVWAAVSGMETNLHALVILLVFYSLGRPRPLWLIAGLLIGLSVWIRPDGITLIGPAGLIALLETGNWQERWLRLGKIFLGMMAGLLTYFAFNFALSGSIWPNTFYAKQAEYAVLLERPLLLRLFSLLTLPLIGPGVLLLPGLAYGVWRGWQEKKWLWIAAFLWWVGYSFLYSLRLPVTYQHGRYLMPAMPVYLTLGGIGMLALSERIKEGMIKRVVVKAWLASLVLVEIGFYVLGANGYGKDVAVIESEMVRVAKWVSSNTPTSALIAAHDIGAIGYFGQRRLVDLAGLITPEVIPFIRDERALADYLDQKKVDYLVTFPDWYPDLVAQAHLVFQTDSQFTREAGQLNMGVYRWRKP